MRHKLTAAEMDFLESLELSLTVGDYFFSHARARPGVALERQSPEELTWIRPVFLARPGGCHGVVVPCPPPGHAGHRRSSSKGFLPYS